MGLLQASPVGYQNTLCGIVHAVLIHVMEEGAPLPDQGPESIEIVQRWEPAVSFDVQLAVGDHQIEHVAVVLDVGRYRLLLSRVRIDPCLVREIQDLVADLWVHLPLHACMIAEEI